MTEWKFRRRQGWCGACERRFDEGERHASCLRVEGEQLAREDACLACWPAASRPDDLFHWFTRHRAGKRGLSLDLASLEQVFLSLEGRAEAKLSELRYLIALLLLRKRRLRVERIDTSGGVEAMLVRRPRRTEVHRVLVHDFPAQRLEELRGELARLFEGGEGSARESASEPESGGEAGGGADEPAGAVGVGG